MSAFKNLRTVVLTITVPTAPVLFWWDYARRDRETFQQTQREKPKVPNVQTIDDLMLQQMKYGDVVLFDRRADRCAKSPLAALACIINRRVLCDNYQDYGFARVSGAGSVAEGRFDHVGVIVPPPSTSSNRLEKLNDTKYILEFTASGIVVRPMSERLMLSQSRSMIFLPLCSPGEARNKSYDSSSSVGGDDDDDEYVLPEKNRQIREKLNERLEQFTASMTKNNSSNNNSNTTRFGSLQASLSILGALGYYLKLHELSPIPVNPSAWLAVSALQEAGVALNVEERAAINAKPEDFLRDYRFNETDTVRLRPGWRFMRPVSLRERTR